MGIKPSKLLLRLLILSLVCSLVLGAVSPSCTDTTDFTYEPNFINYNVAVGAQSFIFNLKISQNEDAIFGHANYEGEINSGFQIFKRDFELLPVWQIAFRDIFVNFEAFGLDSTEQNIYVTTYGSEDCKAMHLSASTGLVTKTSSISGIQDCNSLAISGDYLVIAGRSLSTGNPGVTSLSIGDFAISASISFSSSYDFVSVFPLSKNPTQAALSAFSTNLGRRNLQLDASPGADVSYQLLNSASITDPMSGQILSCTGGCETSQTSRIIELSTGEIFASAIVQIESVMFARFSADINSAQAVYGFAQNMAPERIASMQESVEEGLIYILLSESETYNTIFTYEIATNSITRFYQGTLNFDAYVIATKYGMVFVGGHNPTSGLTALMKAPLTDISVFSAQSFLHNTSVTIETPSDLSFGTAALDYSQDVTISSNTDSVSKLDDEEIRLKTIAKYYFSGPFSNTQLTGVSTTSLNYTMGLICNTKGVVTYTPSVLVNGSRSDWAVENSGVLELDLTDVTAGAYSIVVQIEVSGKSYYYYYTVTVSPCSVDNCATCDSSSGAICVTCESGFTLSTDGTECSTPTIAAVSKPAAEAMGKTVAAVTTSSTVAVVASSSVSAGSAAAAWMMINQYQLLLTTPILETGMPDELLLFMEEFEFFSFNFNFLEKWSFGKIDVAVDSFDFEQKAVGFTRIGYDSGSIIVNEYNFGKAMFTFFSINVILVGLYFALYKFHGNSVFSKISNNLKEFFFWTAYIRILIEAYYYVMLNAFSEIVRNGSDVQEPFSYFCAIVTTLVCFCFPGVLLAHYLKFKANPDLAEGKLKEIYDGFKEKHICRLYYFIFAIRRILSAIVVVSLRTEPKAAKLTLFCTIQLAGLLYAVIVRPFEDHRDNFIEIFNEVLFFFFCLVISILNSESQWSSGLATVILTIIMINGLLIAGILIFAVIKDIVVAVQSKFVKKKIDATQGETEENAKKVEQSEEQDGSQFESKSQHSDPESSRKESKMNLVSREEHSKVENMFPKQSTIEETKEIETSRKLIPNSDQDFPDTFTPKTGDGFMTTSNLSSKDINLTSKAQSANVQTGLYATQANFQSFKKSPIVKRNSSITPKLGQMNVSQGPEHQVNNLFKIDEMPDPDHEKDLSKSDSISDAESANMDNVPDIMLQNKQSNFLNQIYQNDTKPKPEKKMTMTVSGFQNLKLDLGDQS